MRFPHLSRLLVPLSSAGLLLSLGLLSGCNTGVNPKMGWIDPSEVGRYEKEPLIRPILDRLTSGIDEPNAEFSQATDPKPADLIATPRDYVIGKNDLLAVSITDLVGPQVETLKQMRVSETGKISLPLIGQVQATGLTEAQLEVAIQQAYADANLISKAQVSVTTIEARARTFSIWGAVGATGQYAIINSDFRLLDALVLARDVQQPLTDYIYIYRKISSDETTPSANGEGTGPTTAPSNDMLAPKSEAIQPNKPIYLQASEPAAGAPAAPAATPGDEAGGRYIIIDGKPVLVQGTKPATTETPAPDAVAPVAPTPPADATPAAPVMAPSADATATPATATPATTPGQFEFNELTEPGDVRVIRVPYQALKNGELKYNIVIRSQDMIVVPQPTIGEYYMGGHVLRTGVYSLTGRKISLKQAIIAAGMLDQIAIPQQTSLVRRIGTEKEVYAKVDLAAIFAGEQPDIFLKPDDQVMVGTNALAPFVAAIRGAFRITYGFGFLYDRNFAPINR